MRGSRNGWIAIALLIAGSAAATEDCATEKPQANVRRALEKQAAKLLASDVVDAKSLWYCGYGGRDAEAVVESVPRPLADGSALVRQAWCQRHDTARPTLWKCIPSEYRQTDVTLTLAGAPTHFTVVLGSPAAPDVARRLVEQAIALSSQATADNRCGPMAGDRDLAIFNSDFAAAQTAGNSRFTLYQNKDRWQVSRKIASVTLEIPDGGEPRLVCWAAAWSEL